MRRLVGVVDLEGGALRGLDVVDRHAVRSPGREPVQGDADAVALHDDRGGAGGAHGEAGLEILVDFEADELIRPLDGAAQRLGGALRHGELWRLHLVIEAELLLELTAFEELRHDVGAADELTADVQLRDRRPGAVLLDAVADFRVGEHVDGRVLWQERVQDLHRASGKSTLRGAPRALHEQQHVVVLDGAGDAIPGFGVHGAVLARSVRRVKSGDGGAMGRSWARCRPAGIGSRGRKSCPAGALDARKGVNSRPITCGGSALRRAAPRHARAPAGSSFRSWHRTTSPLAFSLSPSSAS